ncbi:SMC-Scp complex subunit ScpB, partial [Candidatus Micrarchaeota archaeon]|nr:SMC-Scp complex subunit ScpB [Candidatus Micrarchaeota archaeon]MBU1939431.1 SMC-Scp complex subunit ScpB [Candidatus Micrarchaeota archaeon]
YIAYKQPVAQAEVINFRNSKAYDHIRALKERGFIRKERTGRTYKIYTTKKFVDYFGKGGKKGQSAGANGKENAEGQEKEMFNALPLVPVQEPSSQ